MPRRLEDYEKYLVMQALCKQPFGEELLAWLFEITGGSKNPVQGTTGGEDVAMNMVAFNLGQRDIWLTIRPFVPYQLLGRIETRDIAEAQLQLDDYFRPKEESEEHGRDDNE